MFKPVTMKLNPSAQRCLPRFFTGDFNFKRLTARRRYKSLDGCTEHLAVPFANNQQMLKEVVDFY
jgi:hypothetical protein